MDVGTVLVLESAFENIRPANGSYWASGSEPT